MRNLSIVIISLMLTLSSCQVVEGIFKAGMWFGILIVAAVVGLIFFLFSRMGGK
ncbi:MAG: hypothetical protein K0Q79_1344 [Flavipsychrobacter sp.]|jgi:Flp pilus assembly protein protease CpaA|nr:hypothetical protein [Flavipsychrobacter sp.]